MSDVYIIGVGMTQFGKSSKSVKELALEALMSALKDAGLRQQDIQAAWFSNSAWGHLSGQHMIRGQVVLRSGGMEGLPVYNVENACASGSTALNLAWMSVKAGLYDCVLALGAEKLYVQDRQRMFSVFDSAIDVENSHGQLKLWSDIKNKVNLAVPPVEEPEAGKSKSAFMDVYAGMAHWHMARFGTTQRQLAVIASKNHYHGSMNSLAQYRKKMSVEEVLNDKVISWPLTRSMCAPIGDGGAAVILCSEKYLRRLLMVKPVRIKTSVLVSGRDRDLDGEDICARAGKLAYEMAGVGPSDINVAEVHDASAFGELAEVEALGFCPVGEGGPFAESGATTLGGKIPINTSGGLECRGHPLGASGLSQIYELVLQLRGVAGTRQVEGARLALAANGGGNIKYEAAALCVHILEKC
jgi:acetyl-CoA acetyltransferase